MTETAYEMNTMQKRALNDFLYFAILTDQHEVKELEVEDSCGDAYVIVTTGLKNDEGTLAEFICRDTYTFFIGKRGGIFQFTSGCKRVYRKYYEVKKTNC